jgi:hypothetical protein
MIETTLMGIWNDELYTQANSHPNLKYDKVWRINWRNWWDCCLLFIEATARGAHEDGITHYERAWEVGDAHYARFADSHGIYLVLAFGQTWEAYRDYLDGRGSTPRKALAALAEKQGGRII